MSEQDADGPAEQRNDRDDPMAPPKEPCECWCMHCNRTFMSSEMWFQRVIGDPQGFEGFWMCPTPNCSGAGFTFDIFPTDPNHPANEGWHCDDDDDEEWFEDEDFEDSVASDDDGEDWDPDETRWKQLQDEFGESDDLEGEEWKHGLQPGERPEPDWAEQARQVQEEEERSYNEPDRRPRELDWSDRQDRRDFRDDDIPF